MEHTYLVVPINCKFNFQSRYGKLVFPFLSPPQNQA